MKNTFCYVAVRTRLELVTPCVTGMYSNQTELTHQEIKASGKRDSNSRPQPWQGCALPTELFPQTLHCVGRDRFELPKP